MTSKLDAFENLYVPKPRYSQT